MIFTQASLMAQALVQLFEKSTIFSWVCLVGYQVAEHR